MRRKIFDIMNFIRNNPNEFPEWHNSDTAKLFSPPKFENKKKINAIGSEKYRYFSCVNVIYKLPLQHESQRSSNL